MNVFLHEMRYYRKSTITWTLSICALCLFMFAIYPSFLAGKEAMSDMLGNFPPSLMAAMNIDIDAIFSVSGFYSYIFFYITLCGAMQATTLGISSISKEGTLKTSDFLLTKPVSRYTIFFAKTSAILCNILITNIFFILVSISFAAIFSGNDFSATGIFMISLTMLFVQLIFASIGLLVGTVARRIKSVLPIATSISFGFFILSMLESLTDDDKLHVLIPYKYFDLNKIATEHQYEFNFLILTGVIVATFTLISCIIFKKKDVHAV